MFLSCCYRVDACFVHLSIQWPHQSIGLGLGLGLGSRVLFNPLFKIQKKRTFFISDLN